MPLDRNDWPTVIDHDVLLDQALEIVVKGAHQPIWILRGFNKLQRNGITRHPQFHRLVINYVTATPDICCWVAGIPPCADIRQFEGGAGFKIPEQYGHGALKMRDRNFWSLVSRCVFVSLVPNFVAKLFV
jgi:hypothetical protein